VCWIAILILQADHVGTNKRSARKMWRAQPYGISIPYIQNTMTHDAYIFMQEYIHFADNSIKKAKGDIG